MEKYNVEFLDDGKNSLSKIAQLIKEGSKILEFGPSHGRFTRFLKNKKNCDVTIVEYDEIAGKIASEFATKSFLGKEIGDIEKYIWMEHLKEDKFDYIIFADVLEHLYDPKLALKRCRDFLNERGSIILSIPNISHNAVLIDLWNDKFEYRTTGILDDTHIRFFTEESLEKLVQECNYFIKRREYVYKNTPEAYFLNSLEDLPQNVAKEIIKRKNGNVFQFIYELSISEEYNSLKDCSLKNTSKEFEAVLYYDTGNGFTEEETIKIPIYGMGIESLEFSLEKIDNIKDIRFDPLNTSCIIKINKILINNEINCTNYNSNGIKKDELNIFPIKDPQIYLNLMQVEKVKQIKIEFTVIDSYINEDNGDIYNELELYKKMLRFIKNQENHEFKLVEKLNEFQEKEKKMLLIIENGENHKSKLLEKLDLYEKKEKELLFELEEKTLKLNKMIKQYEKIKKNKFFNLIYKKITSEKLKE